MSLPRWKRSRTRDLKSVAGIRKALIRAVRHSGAWNWRMPGVCNDFQRGLGKLLADGCCGAGWLPSWRGLRALADAEMAANLTLHLQALLWERHDIRADHDYLCGLQKLSAAKVRALAGLACRQLPSPCERGAGGEGLPGATSGRL